MMRPDADVAVYVCIMPVDMRKQATTLALLVEQALKRNIFEPALYVCSNQRRDRIKIVYWKRNGLCLWSKRLEGRALPRDNQGETAEEVIDASQMSVWLNGRRAAWLFSSTRKRTGPSCISVIASCPSRRCGVAVSPMM